MNCSYRIIENNQLPMRPQFSALAPPGGKNCLLIIYKTIKIQIFMDCLLVSAHNHRKVCKYLNNQLKDEMWNITGRMVKCVLSGLFIILQCTLCQFSYPGHRIQLSCSFIIQQPECQLTHQGIGADGVQWLRLQIQRAC